MSARGGGRAIASGRRGDRGAGRLLVVGAVGGRVAVPARARPGRRRSWACSWCSRRLVGEVAAGALVARGLARRCWRSRRCGGGWCGRCGRLGCGGRGGGRGRTAGCRGCVPGRVTSIPAGELVRVRASRGSSLAHVEQRAEELAVCLQAREVRVARDPENAATGTVTLVRRDPLAGVVSVPWPHRDADELSLWEPVPVGVDELGAHGHGGAAGAQRAAGRRAGRGQERGALGAGGDGGAGPERAGVAARRQARGAVGVGAVRAAARRPGHRRGDRAAARAARRRWSARYRELLARGQRKVAREDGLPLHLVACDELAFYLGHEDRKKQTRVRRAAARPRRPRPRGGRDRVRGDAEAGGGRGADARCGTCSGSGSRCAATRRRRRTRSSARAGRRSGHDAATIAPGAARRRAAAGGGRHCRSGCADSTWAMPTWTSCRRGPPRCAPTMAARRGGAVVSARRKVPDELFAERERRSIDELAFRVLGGAL